MTAIVDSVLALGDVGQYRVGIVPGDCAGVGSAGWLDVWLHRVGPTAACLWIALDRHAHCCAGMPLPIEWMEGWTGTKRSTVINSLERLIRFSPVRFVNDAILVPCSSGP